MKTRTQMRLELERELNNLVAKALAYEMVVTIEIKPFWPPEMGAHYMMSDVRDASSFYRRPPEKQNEPD